jgi:hypothetical protein
MSSFLLSQVDLIEKAKENKAKGGAPAAIPEVVKENTGGSLLKPILSPSAGGLLKPMPAPAASPTNYQEEEEDDDDNDEDFALALEKLEKLGAASRGH